jgi:hypothetical protein
MRFQWIFLCVNCTGIEASVCLSLLYILTREQWISYRLVSRHLWPCLDTPIAIPVCSCLPIGPRLIQETHKAVVIPIITYRTWGCKEREFCNVTEKIHRHQIRKKSNRPLVRNTDCGRKNGSHGEDNIIMVVLLWPRKGKHSSYWFSTSSFLCVREVYAPNLSQHWLLSKQALSDPLILTNSTFLSFCL